MRRRVSAITLYMQDQQGSTYGIVREDGASAKTYRYTDFGETEDCDQWNLYAYCANDPVDHMDITEHAKLKVVKKGIKKEKVSLKVNDAKNIRCRDRKKKPYDQYIYIKTDSEKAYSYAKRIKKGKYYHVYGLTTRNCGWVAIDILSHTPIGKEKRNNSRINCITMMDMENN